ncbi:hypothetical protein DL96DRAFT_1682129 [Flagelloscypha sp. PMI_526]|nr:hypothetical protein DL96DRAFT_1682129 [Flagelloscypha sp. PMI_526]
MPTPRDGTHQHPELESLPPRISLLMKWQAITGIDIEFILWLLGLDAILCAYNIVACVLGRFFLDHFHLWKQSIPPDARSIDKYGELIAAFLAGCLSLPATLGLVYMCLRIDDMLDAQGKRFQILGHDILPFALILFMIFSMVPIAGAIVHPGLHYVKADSMLAVYWFGSLLIVSSLALITAILIAGRQLRLKAFG